MLKKINLTKIPASTGFFVYWKEKKPLFAEKTYNLQKSITNYSTEKTSNKAILALRRNFDNLTWVETENLFEALICEKEFKKKIPYENFINLFKDYVYLSINLEKAPHFKISEDTNSNYFFIGPFRKRFFLLDVFTSFAKVCNLPEIEDNYVGDFLEVKKLIEKFVLKVHPTLIKDLSKKREKALQELDFSLYDEIKIYQNFIKKYYEYLDFFYLTKNINLKFEYKNKFYSVKNGLLENEKIFTNYRENELLAVNKEEFDQRRIVYYHLKENKLI